ncbi:MAG: D-glycero-beta-D-manno-heptose-7-phosphate kinase [Thermodesulfobacteriota bacterium]
MPPRLPKTPSPAHLASRIPDMAGSTVVIVGDCILDHYLVGEVSRISPEAPVPVVQVKKERHLLGGAGNVARNVQTLGGAPVLVGLVGSDPAAGQLKELLAEQNITARLVQDPARPTTRKTRIIAHNQQVVRVDREQCEPVRGPILDQIFSELEAALQAAPVLILSDYGKGLVTRRFMDRLWELINRLPKRPLVLVDPKVRNFALYKGVDLLTPNTKEAAEGSGVPIEDRTDILRAGLAVFRKLQCRHLLITLGPDGMALFQSPEQVLHIHTAAQKVFDVTGAGDTVIATLALALAAGFSLLESCILANHAAGIVVGEVGAAAVAAQTLRDHLSSAEEMPVESWLHAGG